MGKRERENPCPVCGHYHKHEEGEVCGICGHIMPITSNTTCIQLGALPSEILPDFLYLGSYDNASRCELLKTLGISHILNTVPSCQNLPRNSFVYHSLQDDKSLPFDDAIQVLELCQREKARVIVHCMSGKSRSAAIVIAYLMKCKAWRLEQSYQWVKERRPSVELTQATYEQLQEYEQKVIGSNETTFPAQSMSFGFERKDAVAMPAFNTSSGSSIFERPLGVPPQQFAFGAAQGVNQTNPSASDMPLGGT